MEWRLAVVNQVPYEIMTTAFRWWHNIGDALHHFAHFGSFLSETHREEAVKVLGAMSTPPKEFEKELTELKYYVDHAPINPNKPTITTIC
jgi:hypothetical protein